MLIKIGTAKEPLDIVDLLLECHERIRTFVNLAARLSEAHDAPVNEVRDAATRITRYFSESLPLHVADEEESILPRLSGKDAAVDTALAAMRTEHAEHEPQLALLLDICSQLQASPERLGELGPALATTAASLGEDFLTHLEKEESVILPAIRNLLSLEDRNVMLGELRARRAS